MEIDWKRNYWAENFRMSVELATKHTNWAKLVFPIIVVILAVGGVSTQSQSFAVRVAAGIPAGIAAYLILLMLFVTPHRIWSGVQKALQPKLAFVDHDDNYSTDFLHGVFYARVTIQNTGATPLTNVEVMAMEIDPQPAELLEMALPLRPLHAPADSTMFTLRPLETKSVGVAHQGSNQGENVLFTGTGRGPEYVEDGDYRLRLRAVANETTPSDIWLTVTFGRKHVPAANGQHARNRILFELKPEVSLDKPMGLAARA